MRLGSERRVQGEEISQRQQIIEFLDQFHLERARATRRKIGIVGEHAHAEGDRAPAEFGADPAHADDA